MRAGTPGWITHAGGIGKLIEARGPELHKTYPEKSIFLESRMLLVCPSFQVLETILVIYLTFTTSGREWDFCVPKKLF